MSSITGLISAGCGGGGTPVNSIARLYTGGQTLYTDEAGGVWLKTGSVITPDETTYPDATIAKPLSGASFTTVFSVSAQDTSPQGITFNNDGTKMYVVGASGDDVNEYALSTAFDVSTASYTTNFAVSSQTSLPRSITFNGDGTKMFINDVASKRVLEYALSTGFNISTASYTTAFSVSGLTSPSGCAFSNDGTKMFVLDSDTQNVKEYNLSTAFSVTTAALSTSFNVTSQDSSPLGFAFNSTGSKMYIIGNTNDSIFEYNLSTAFSVSTASYSTSFSIASQETTPVDMAFNSDDSKMYVCGISSAGVNEYSIPEIMGVGEDTGAYDYVKLK